MNEQSLAQSPVVIDLADPAARDSRVAGAKAASLARAHDGGLPTLPGMVLTTVGASTLFATVAPPSDVTAALHRRWRALSGDGRRPVVVRSSSTIEDAATSSMAGRFTSVLDVKGWPQFLTAVRTVLDSATNPQLADAPMAVLVQPFLAAARGGVLFGADPVTGNAEHLVVAAVNGGPDALVAGQVDGATTTLDRSGRFLAGAPIERRIRRRLAALAARSHEIFGGPQDVEWAIDSDGRLWLLQSRPITAAVRQPTGPRLGPGPVAETFPDALAPLEADLWVGPLRGGIADALILSGTASARDRRRSPIVVTVAGRVAADLDLLEPPPHRGLFRRLDPRPGARRLRAAWRVGRLRAAFPALVDDLVDETDDDLLDVPALASLSERQLVGVLDATRTALRALHGHEVLAGLLLKFDASGVTASGVALAALAEGRTAGLADAAILERDPVVLTLIPPRIDSPAPLPAIAAAPPTATARATDADLATASREALRIRIRWVHELSAVAASELGSRLEASGRLPHRHLVRWLTFDELAAAVDGAASPPDLESRPTADPDPLPAYFRLSEDGEVVPDLVSVTSRGAGGGRGHGPVVHPAGAAPGSVLVVRTLDPSLAPLLPGLRGLVAETGSPLSHLAILAREYGVPTVVGLAGALSSFRPGDVVEVDGATGTVRPLDVRPPAVDDGHLLTTAQTGGNP